MQGGGSAAGFENEQALRGEKDGQPGMVKKAGQGLFEFAVPGIGRIRKNEIE